MQIEIKNLTNKFKDFELSASLSIPKASLTTLLGPSGSGKTTLLNLIAGFLHPNSGSIYLGTREITHLPVQKRPIGMVFQDYALFPHMNVRENIAYGLKIEKTPKAERELRIKELLELVHLPDFSERRISSLSGGERQRVALARALAPKPRVLLLDEPLSALDAQLRLNLRQEIRDIVQKLGITTVFVTHDQEEAMVLSDKIVLMSEGRIVQQGSPRDIYENPNSTFSATFLGRSNILDFEDKLLFFRPHHLKLVKSEDSPPLANSQIPSVYEVNRSSDSQPKQMKIPGINLEKQEFYGNYQLLQLSSESGPITVQSNADFSWNKDSQYQLILEKWVWLTR